MHEEVLNKSGDCQAKTYVRHFLCFHVKMPFGVSRPMSSFILVRESQGDPEKCLGEESGHK